MPDVGQTQINSAEIDFGSAQYQVQSQFTIVDPNVNTSSKIMAEVSYKSPSDNRLVDETAVEVLDLKCQAGSGQFILNVESETPPVTGKFVINYLVTN